MHNNWLLELEANPMRGHLNNIDYLGISFFYPEDKCTGIKWMGSGPSRLWKNRTHGSNIGFWEKEYNNTITGERFNELIYPEFKGYHGNLDWATFETIESDFTVTSETPNLYFRLFTPEKPQDATPGTFPTFPKTDIPFLYAIPAIGTKFKTADKLGPTSQKGVYSGVADDQSSPIKLCFDFRTIN